MKAKASSSSSPPTTAQPNGELVLVVHPDAEVARRLERILEEAGFWVSSAASHKQAEEQVRGLRFSPPAVLLTVLDEATERSPILERMRAKPLGGQIAVVGLGTGDDEERRRSLRLGLAHLVPPPYEEEELVLSTCRALDRQRREHRISGSLSQLSAAELLQTAESNRRSGTIALESQGRTATVWLREGRVVDAETEDGHEAEEAVYVLATWEEGSFEAEFRPVSVTERISTSTTGLLLEAMRRKDEHQRHAAPPHAAIPDPPPPPPKALLTLHRALTLLNVATSYAADHLAPALVERRTEAARRRIAEGHALAHEFTVHRAGQVAFDGESGDMPPPHEIVETAVAWSADLFRDLERALPNRFGLDQLRSASEAVADDLESLGFYEALDRSPGSEENP